ncbi:MAG TPA: linear amide C-N hydrolase, partial [Ignavibacteriaceae bacterium]|nr:linear amide C-N hydrolase [Ignavibacteriaceae bacterium]
EIKTMKIIKMIFMCFIVLSFRIQAQSINNADLFGCSTFILSNEKCCLIRHNLDMYPDIPGMIYINKKGLEKESISFAELFCGVKDTLPKLKWVSKYGSVTYNPLARELIDGGLNEVGLYIGEMSLNQNNQYPVYDNKPKIAVALWLQYILDNFSSVDEVIEFIPHASLDGQGFNWHFFSADKKGNQAIIEFINGRTVIHKNNEVPVKLLCNNSYDFDLNRLKQFNGFGGNNNIDLTIKSEENRFINGAQMLELYKQNPVDTVIDHAFDILKELDFGITKWSIVYDVNNMKMYYRTNKNINIKHFDFSTFDFSCTTPVMMIDINKDLPSWDVKEYFIPYSKQTNKTQIENLFKGIDGFKERKDLPEMVERFANYPETVKCK